MNQIIPYGDSLSGFKRKRDFSEEDYEFDTPPSVQPVQQMSNDYAAMGAAIAAGLRGNKSRSYRLRIPIGSALDTNVRGVFGDKYSDKGITWEAQQARNKYGYTGAGRYRRPAMRRRRLGMRRRFTGRGMYMGGRGGYWGRKIGGYFGKADLGDKLGDIGSGLISQFVPGGATAMGAARAAGRVFSGQGEYTSNNLVEGGDPIPSFAATPDGSRVTISHREYIGDIFAPPTGDVFQNSPFSVNPGLEKTFPWLSQIAQNYDEYTLHQLMFSYRSTVSDFAASSGQIGQVIMATIYNASSDPFADKAAMMQYDSSMSTKTSESMIHGVECDPSKLSGPIGRFVRSNPVLVGQDINQYDHGLFNIAVTETPVGYANQAMGELWVSYTVELRKPKFFTNRGLGISRDVFANVVAGDGINQQSPFGTANQGIVLRGQQNNIGGQLLQYTGGTVPSGLVNLVVAENNNAYGPSSGSEISAFQYVLPANYAGNLRIAVRQTCATPSTTSLACWGQGNVSPINDVMGNANDIFVTGATGNVGNRVQTQWFDIRVESASNGVDNTLWFAPGTAAAVFANTTNMFLDITEYNFGLSYKQDGSRDNLILIDASGTVQNL